MSETKMLTFSEEVGDELLQLIDTIITDKKQRTSTILNVAPTGKGKSFFIKNGLYDYCKKRNMRILYLLPRSMVKEEFMVELQAENKTDVITVDTYQNYLEKEDYASYEEYLQLEENKSFTKFDIIICDECHYFIADSTFNQFTYKSYNHIFTNGADKVRIFITATPNPIKQVMADTIQRQNINIPDKKERHLLYYCECQGISAVKDIKFFLRSKKKEEIRKYLKEIDKTEDKAIVFCDSKSDALDLHKSYESNSMFICSMSAEKSGDYFDNNAVNKYPEVYQKMLREHNFDCKYVFCTSALDVGFSIKDKQVKHIICTLRDWNSVIQAVGRKRIMDNDMNDRITLYLPYYKNNEIGRKKSEGLKMLEHRNYLNSHGAAAYMAKYEKILDSAKVVYYRHIGNGICEPAIDNFVLENIYRQNWIWYKISQIDSTEQHQDWILQQFGLPNKRHERTLYGIERDLKPFADSKRVFTQKDKEIIVNIINHKNRENGLQVKSMQKLEEYLQKIGCRYMIVIGSKRETIDGKDKKTTTYQIIERPTGQDE